MAAEQPEASAIFDGLSVTVKRSLGVDRALVVHIDGPEALSDWTEPPPRGVPAIRVFLNEATIYDRRPFVDVDPI